MKLEFSAGGIVFKKENDQLFVLLEKHSQYHKWAFPKGLIGDTNSDESKEETAIREVKEETGINAKIVTSDVFKEEHWYVWEGEKRKKTVYYYVMEYIGGDFSEKDDEMEEVEWVPIDKVVNKLSFKNSRDAFEKARPVIEKLAKEL